MIQTLKRNGFMLYRAKNGLSLHDISDKTGLSIATLSRLERGLTRLTPRSHILIRDGLGISHQAVLEFYTRQKENGVHTYA